jgi:hypothetical protein
MTDQKRRLRTQQRSRAQVPGGRHKVVTVGLFDDGVALVLTDSRFARRDRSRRGSKRRPVAVLTTAFTVVTVGSGWRLSYKAVR